MKKIYFLDRNAISEIKKNIEGKLVDLDRLKKLRSIDKNSNTISAMLFIREGQKRRIENSDEIKESLEKDIPYLEKFYRKAKTDSQFFMEKTDRTSDIFSDEKGKETNWNNYIKFLCYAQELLHQPIAKRERLVKAQDIIAKGKSLSISNGHPTIICALSVLYRNPHSIKILKSKKTLSDEEAQGNAYNALNDLIVISRLCDIQATIKSKIMLKFFTFDDGLLNFFKYFEVPSITRISDGNNAGVKIRITYSDDLFTEATPEEREKIIQEIKK